MRYFTYISKTCELEAKEHSVKPEVLKLAQLIEKQQSVDNLDPHDQFLKKKLGRSFRLIIGRKYEGDDCLLVFWRVFPKGSSDYRRFCENPAPFADRFEQACVKDDLEKVWAEKRVKTDIPQLADLSDDERAYLYQLNNQQQDEWLVLESEDWVQRTDKETGGYSSYISNLHPLVFDLTDKPQSTVEKFEGNLGILFRRIPEEKVLYLIAPVRMDQQDDILILKERYKNELQEQVSQEHLLRKSKRAYPSFVIYQPELWIHDIQEKDEKANLALSKEEAEVLRSREKGYPLFINGRPGSGKSTVLQYLFAEHVYHHLTYNRLQGLPLYLTYNKELLDIARDNVVSILTSNANKLDSRIITENEAKETVGLGFVDFREYLFSLLPPEARFREEKYIGYPEFRLLFENKFSKHPDSNIRKITAELAWHVIRTYIKGTVSDENEFLEPDEFRELPSKPEKSITDSTYDIVYDTIWSKWYKELCDKEGYWDDQDLARKLLLLASSNQADFQLDKHPVIFCDEAQDFTRNELRLIFRLSLFSRRNLTPDVLQRIPFAFAGDPFQTLNPTGFDWESTSTTFYHTIIDQLDKRQKPTLKLNYRELAFNYRSTRNIVQLCNFIHLMRGIAFGKKDLMPQRTWFDKAADMPVYFDVSSPVLQSKLREQQEIVIIVPCAEGEEESYVKQDDFLKTIALSEDGEQIIRNVLSPMRAKGQEFSRVVIYKFGEECRKDYSKLIELLEPDRPVSEMPQEQIIPLEYFVNRLYVSASRAEKRLFIADTEAGLNEFWKFFEKFDPDVFVTKYKKYIQHHKANGQFPWSGDDLVKIQPGSQENWDKDHDDPGKLAEEFFRSGLRLKDTYKLRLAIQNFQASNKPDKAFECEGWLLEFTGEYEKAGERFEKLGNVEKALQLYWKAAAFKKIAGFNENSLENKAAAFMLSPTERSLTDSRDFLNEIAAGIKTKQIFPDNIWATLISEIVKYIANRNKESALPPYEWSAILSTVQEFSQLGLLPKTEERYLELLRARATPYPEKLEVLQKIGSEPRQIVQYYFQNQQVPLSEAQLDILFLALQKLGQYNEVEKLLDAFPSLRRDASLLAAYIRESQLQSQIEPFVQKILLKMTGEEAWDIALEFVLNKTLPVEDTLADVIKKHSWNNLLDVLFIRALAVSERLSKADKSIKNRVSKYLESKLLERASAFYSQLTVAQAGAALERANMIRDCLEFYEYVWEKQNWPANEEERQFAQERWLVCKNRQLEISKNNNVKQRITRELQVKREEWKIVSIENLPEYPATNLNDRPKPVKPVRDRKMKLPPTPEPRPGSGEGSSLPGLFPESPPVPTPGKGAIPTVMAMNIPSIEFTLTLNGSLYKSKIARERGKMTIQFNNDQEMITLTAKGLKLRGSDDDFEECIKEEGRSEKQVSYFVTSWNLTCVLRQEKQHVFVDLYQGDTAVDLISLRIN